MTQSLLLDATLCRDIMNRRVESLRPRDTIRHASDWLEKKGYSGAPVLGPEGQLLGVLSEFDCLSALMKVCTEGPSDDRVEDHMTRKVETVSEDTNVAEVSAKFAEMSWRRLIVTAAPGGPVTGIVSRRDLMRALKSMTYEPRWRDTYQALRDLWR